MDKVAWEKDYNQGIGIDCPHCGQDRPEHSCRNCYSEMNQETCWKNKGFCSEKCLKYVNEDLPAIRKHKEEMGIVCKCDEPQCGKCLSVNCKDKECPTHTKEAKIAWRKRWEVANKKPFPHSENY